MFKKIRQESTRLFLAAIVILMMVGAPTVTPAYADCSTTSGSCDSST